jgi:hypothetical protein
VTTNFTRPAVIVLILPAQLSWSCGRASLHLIDHIDIRRVKRQPTNTTQTTRHKHVRPKLGCLVEPRLPAVLSPLILASQRRSHRVGLPCRSHLLCSRPLPAAWASTALLRMIILLLIAIYLPLYTTLPIRATTHASTFSSTAPRSTAYLPGPV